MPSVLLSSSVFEVQHRSHWHQGVWRLFPFGSGESLFPCGLSFQRSPPFLACGFFLHLQSQQPSISLSSLLPCVPSLSLSLSFLPSPHLFLLLWSSWLPYIRTPVMTRGSTQWIHLDSSGSFPHLRIYLVASVSPLCHVRRHIHRFWGWGGRLLERGVDSILPTTGVLQERGREDRDKERK